VTDIDDEKVREVLEKARLREPYFRPAVVPGPFDVGGLDDAMWWLGDFGEDAAFARECVQALGGLLLRARDLGNALNRLWEELEEISDDSAERMRNEQHETIVRWCREHMEDEVMRDTLVVVSQLGAMLRSKRQRDQ